MELDRVVLNVEVDNLDLMPEIQKALSDLDIKLYAELEGLQAGVRGKMGEGVVRVSYSSDGIINKEKGPVILLGLSFQTEHVPSVAVGGLENLSDYKVDSGSNGITIVRVDENAIRYNISREIDYGKK